MEPEEYENKRDKRNSHINSELHLIYISTSNNIRATIFCLSFSTHKMWHVSVKMMSTCGQTLVGLMTSKTTAYVGTGINKTGKGRIT